MKVEVVVEWKAGLAVQLNFDKTPTAGDVLKRLQENQVYDKEQYKFGHIYGYKNSDEILEDRVLLSNSIEPRSNKHSMWNWIFPIFFWILVSVPFILRKFKFSLDTCSILLLLICGFLAYIAYRFNLKAIFYPKRTTNSLDKYEIGYIFFFYALSPKVGEEEIEEFMKGDNEIA